MQNSPGKSDARSIIEQLEAFRIPRNKEPGHGVPDLADIGTRAEKVDAVTAQLKSEFAGLDSQIDQIMTLVKPWFVLPQAQRRPTVISLWGMTGVGKSSLVLRLVELLESRHRYGFMDLGKSSERFSHAFETPAPFNTNVLKQAGHAGILFFDEIHNFRTVDYMGQDIERPQLGDFWTLIDSGILPKDYEAYDRVIQRHLTDLRMNAVIEGEYPDHNIEEYLLTLVINLLELRTDASELRQIAKQDPKAYLEWSTPLLQEYVRDLRPYDFTQCLIFTAGNLDEIYQDSYALNVDDMNAEDLYAKTSKVGPDKLRSALLRRFRPEQVARMGNLQVIFPSLSKKAFQSLIRLRLGEISKWLEASFKIKFHFDESVMQLILHEGVVPAQGARPVLSAITEHIEIRTSSWVIAASTAKAKSIDVVFDLDTKRLECRGAGQVLHASVLKLREDRLPEIDINPAMNETICIHEAGHAVAGIVLQGRLPIKVLTGSMAWHRGGPRVEFRPTEFMSRDTAENMLSILLAGFAAEELYFGKAGVSMGASSDLQKATNLAGMMITQCGMGDHYSVSFESQNDPFNTISHKRRDDEEIEQLLSQAMARTRKLLTEQRSLLDAIFHQITNSERVTGHALSEAIRNHYQGDADEIEAILTREHPREHLFERRDAHKPKTRPRKGSLKKAA